MVLSIKRRISKGVKTMAKKYVRSDFSDEYAYQAYINTMNKSVGSCIGCEFFYDHSFTADMFSYDGVCEKYNRAVSCSAWHKCED